MDSEQDDLGEDCSGKDCSVRCPQCGRDFVPVEAQKYCAFCGGRLEGPQVKDREERSGASGDYRTTKAAGQEGIPGGIRFCAWEQQEELGLIGAMIQTVTRSLFSPGPFFAVLPRQGGYALPLLYALILETFGGMMSSLWAFLVGSPWLTSAELTEGVTLTLAFLIPLVAIVGTFVSALMFHGCLILVAGVNEAFQATFRVVCYSSGPELLNVIPVVGPFAALFWKLYLVFVGLREVQRTTTGTVLTAMLVPILVAGALMLAGLALSLLGTDTTSG